MIKNIKIDSCEKDKKMKNILLIMNYAAPYKGNFIESIERLELNYENKYNFFYMFVEEAQNIESKNWIDKMKNKNIIFLKKSNVKNYFLLNNFIKKNNIEIVHIHFLGIKMNVMLAVLQKKYKFKLIRHLHNHFDEKSKIKKIFGNIFYKKTYFIGCSCSVTQSLINEMPKLTKNAYAVDNAINFDRLKEIDQTFHFKNNGMNVLMFGFQFERKGVDLAISAIKLLREEGNNIFLNIVISRDLDINIKKITDFCGGKIYQWISILQPREDIGTYYNNCDIFISPSREEGMCYSIAEAAWFNCRIVASKIDGQIEYNSINYIFWFNDESVDELKKQIINAYNCKEKLNYMNVNRKKLLKNFNLDKWVKEINKIYEV